MSTSSRIVLCGLLVACLLPTTGTSGPALAARITLLGTTVDADGMNPTPGVRVTLWPQGRSTWSDGDGDFLLDWDGSRGWLTFVPPDSMLTGKLWCKRLALQPVTDASAQPHDVGLIRVIGRARLTYQSQLSLPMGVGRPDTLTLPGPAPGGSDSCRVRLRYEGDIWGHVTKVEKIGGDTEPPALVEAILDWVRHVDWVVPSETSCESDPPFTSLDDVRYVWDGSIWKRIDPVAQRMEELQRQRAARKQSKDITPQ